MDAITKQLDGLTLEEKRTFHPYFIGSIVALAKYSTDGKIDIKDINKAAEDSRKYAFEEKNNPPRQR